MSDVGYRMVCGETGVWCLRFFRVSWGGGIGLRLDRDRGGGTI